MKQNFAISLYSVLQHEGGLVNDPQDKGGLTNFGVTQRVYDDWRRGQGLQPRSVRSIENTEVSNIYRTRYWDAIRGDELPSGVDYAVFDMAINSGVNRAIRFLQRVVGATEDGQLGPKTLAAVNAANNRLVVIAYNAERQTYLESLSNFPHFGDGWTERVKEVTDKCVGMCG